MSKTKIVTGLDIGTESIKALILSKSLNSGEVEILCKVKTQNSGMRRGVVVRPEQVTQRIDLVLKQIQAETDRKIDEVYVNISGSHIFSATSKGSIVVSRADQKISREDIFRAIEAAKTFPLPKNKEIIDYFPKQFTVDGESGIKEPLEMKGLKLEAEVLAIGAFSPYFKNLTSSVLEAGLHIGGVFCSAISSAKACLAPQQKELGVVLLDIGAGTTDLSIYEEGDLIHLAVIPIGSGHITNDIAIALRTDISLAEKIKKEFGSCLKSPDKKSKKKEKMEFSSLTFSSKLLRKVIEARVCEIFDLVQKEIKKVSSGILPSGIVITGGGVNLPNIVELAKKELKLPCRIGNPGFSREEEEPEDPSFSTAFGLALLGLENGSEKGISLGKGIRDKIKKAFRVFIP
jgi:cell division protein FtsA